MKYRMHSMRSKNRDKFNDNDQSTKPQLQLSQPRALQLLLELPSVKYNLLGTAEVITLLANFVL